MKALISSAVSTQQQSRKLISMQLNNNIMMQITEALALRYEQKVRKVFKLNMNFRFRFFSKTGSIPHQTLTSQPYYKFPMRKKAEVIKMACIFCGYQRVSAGPITITTFSTSNYHII
jgi:hypothetical protein